MKNILIINGHEVTPYSKGELTGTLINNAKTLLTENGNTVEVVNVVDGYDVAEQLKKLVWADTIVVQMPLFWMNTPSSLKKYIDDVFTAGMDGTLCNFDGRTSEAPKANYGTGGTQTNTKYMISITCNAPKEAFNNEKEYLFQGKGLDDLLFPTHLSFRFFGMQQLPSFACYDVVKNPGIENDLKRFDNHIKTHLL